MMAATSRKATALCGLTKAKIATENGIHNNSAIAASRLDWTSTPESYAHPPPGAAQKLEVRAKSGWHWPI